MNKRIECQKIIDAIYWNNRIWPAENVKPKPSFESRISDSAIITEVENIAKKSNALEYYWQKPVTAKQLQEEIDRIARNSKQPHVLEEVWSALDNDPHLIAECFARPILVDRIIRSTYAFDKKIHRTVRETASEDMKKYSTIAGMKMMQGKYSEVELVKVSDRKQAEMHYENTSNKIFIDEEEWEAEVSKIAEYLNSKGIEDLPVGILSELRENENQFYTIAILHKSSARIRFAIVRWEKTGFQSWWNDVQGGFPVEINEPFYRYRLPVIMQSCVLDSWKSIAASPGARAYHTAVWTGTEMIIWGGRLDTIYKNDGSRYNPSIDAWISMSPVSSLEARSDHTAVWTGEEMIIWGGCDSDSSFNTGARYNPATDGWISTSVDNAPTARCGHSATWIGSEMVVWGGSNYDTGARYNPAADTWTQMSTINAPSARKDHTDVWTGTEIIIWGGYYSASDNVYFNTGAKYNPATDTWNPLSLINAPDPRSFHTAIWSGYEMIIWGGYGGNLNHYNDGFKYNPVYDSWESITNLNAPLPRSNHSVIWTGTDMIIWGGSNSNYAFNDGGKYNISSNTWTSLSINNAPTVRRNHTAVWSGEEMIIWGGYQPYGSNYYENGARYNPVTDTWITTASTGPSARANHTAVWTGMEMIIWGGSSSIIYYNSGSRYYPVTDSWISTSTVNCPVARSEHTAIWTGEEMIVWGGSGLNSGAKYNPVTDTWATVSTTNAPAARARHTAVWTGEIMIIWGGYASGSYLNTGGRYNPVSDSWSATSLTNALSAREDHSAVWTGSDMIIWGGYSGNYNYYNNGAKYNPLTDTWTGISLNGPSARGNHTAVWTGTEMVIWGGTYSSSYDSGGRYDPGTDEWYEMSAIGAPAARTWHTAVWALPEMIIWGGTVSSTFYAGAKYNTMTDSWTPVSTALQPANRYYHTAVWTGEEMIIWGGYNGNLNFNSGGRYCACNNIPPLNINAVSTGLNEITITWSAVPSATGYNIYRRYILCSKQTEELIGGNITSLSYIDTTVSGATSYEYSVSAITQCESSKSNWVAATATGDCALMPCFNGVSEVINNQNANCSLTVQWNAPTSNCSSYPDITYTVYRGTAPGFPIIPVNQAATCLTGTSFIDTAMAYETMYYYAVRAEDSRNGSQGPCNGGNIDDNMTRKNNAPTGPFVELINDDFETGLDNWAVSSHWNWTSTQAHSGIYSAHSGNLNDQLCDTLSLTDLLNFPANVKATLHFWTRFQTETGDDAGIVEASSNGTAWIKLPLQTNYPGNTYSTAPTCLGLHPQPAFTGTNTAWAESVADISSYAGGNFKMRFNYATDSSYVVGGWWIDDVRIDYVDTCTSAVNPPGKILNTLMVSKSNGYVMLNWLEPGNTCTVAAFGVYRGLLPFIGYNHAPLHCNVNNTMYRDEQAVMSYYYLVVPHNGMQEGSYGVNSYGAERPQGASPCKTLDLGICN